MKKVKIAVLAKTATELNELMGLKPPIKVQGANEDTLVEGITKASKFIDKKNDELTPLTIQTLKDLDLWDKIGEVEAESEPEAEPDDISREEQEQALLDAGTYTAKQLKKMTDGEVAAAFADLNEDLNTGAEEPEVSREEQEQALLDAGTYTAKQLKKMTDEEVQEAYDELQDAGTEDVSREEQEAALIEAGEYTAKQLKKMGDDEVTEAYNELNGVDAGAEEAVELTREEQEAALIEAGEYTAKQLKKMTDDEVAEAYNELNAEAEPEPELSREDMEQALLDAGEYTAKQLKKMTDDEVAEAYNELNTVEEEPAKPAKSAKPSLKAPAKSETKRVPPKRFEGPSAQEVANKLYLDQAGPEVVFKTFSDLYKVRKPEADVDFVKKRIAIYMKIAKDTLPAPKASATPAKTCTKAPAKPAPKGGKK